MRKWSDLSPAMRSSVRLALGVVIASSAGLVFLDLAGDIREGDTERFDDALLVWLANHRAPALTSVFLSITALGSWPVLTLLTIGTCVGVALLGKLRAPLVLGFAMTGAPALTRALKVLYGRARPRVVPHLDTVADASFPSGHTVASVTFFVTIALLASRYTRRHALRAFLVGYALVVAALVALSRVYLGVHYPSDVAGGALVGIAWSLVCVLGDHLLGQRKSPRGPQAPR